MRIIMKERILTKILSELCAEQKIILTQLCGGWVLELSYKDKKHYIYGYHFDLNQDTASLIAQDKHATLTILKRNTIPVIEQFYIQQEDTPLTVLENGLTFPLVCKPNQGGGGRMISQVHNFKELNAALKNIHQRERGAAISLFFTIKTEYRVIILNGEILLTYGKETTKNSWQHNLSKGAKPVLEIPENTQVKLHQIARKAMAAINLSFGTVDIVDIAEKGDFEDFQVLEINSGISLELFSQINPECQGRTREIYKKVLDTIFGEK